MGLREILRFPSLRSGQALRMTQTNCFYENSTAVEKEILRFVFLRTELRTPENKWLHRGRFAVGGVLREDPYGADIKIQRAEKRGKYT